MDAKRVLPLLVAALAWLNPSAMGYEMGYSSLEQRLSKLEKRIGESQSVKEGAKSTTPTAAAPAAFLSDDEDDATCCDTCGEAGCCSCCESKECGDSCCCTESYTCGESCECEESCGCADACNGTNYCGKLYTEVQITWLRTHINEEVVGKLEERYKVAPRLIMGYEDPNGIGARVRYWRYSDATETLGGNDDIVLDFTTIDVEATSRFQTRRTDFVIAGGFRWFDGEIGSDGREVNSQMPGLTVAADLRSIVCGDCRKQWGVVGGARWSILGRNWEGRNGLVDPARDDNMVVQELYGGVEYACRRGSVDLYTRLVFEVQNWRSDVLGDNTNTDSIGLVGPGVHVGANF